MKRYVALLMGGLLFTGCYTLQPVVSTQPLIGTQVALGINDVGRAVLGGSMGPEIDEIEGRLVQRNGGEFVIAVATVRLLRGGEQTWTGERIVVKSEYVTQVREKKFSRGRTALLSAVALGGVAILVTRAIVGSGRAAPLPAPGDSNSTSIRIPWP